MKLNNKKTLNNIREDLSAKKVDAEIILNLLNVGINKSFLYENYLNYKNFEGVMDNSKIYLLDYFKKTNKKENDRDLRKRYEEFGDDVAKAILKDKAKKLMKPIKSNKNKHLISSDGTTEKLFLEFAMLNVNKEFIQKNIAKKINMFKTSEELNKELRKLVESFGSWNFNGQMDLFENQNINIISTKDNKILFEVNDFDSCHELGSPMWCITREKETFDDYREDVERIMFCYDLNKTIEDNESKTAYIVNASGHVSSGYYKDDLPMNSDKFTSIENHFEAYSVNDFRERLLSNDYTEEDRYLILLSHGFNDVSDSIDIDDFDYDKFSQETFQKLISKRNSGALKHIIETNPDLLIHGSRNKGAFLESAISFISESFCSETSGMLTLIIDNKKLLNAAMNSEGIDLFKDPLYNFSFYRTENKYDLFEKYLEKSEIDIMEILKKSKHFSDDAYKILTKYDCNLQERVKKELPEVACKMITSHPMSDAINFLDISKNDNLFLEMLELGIKEKSFRLENTKELSILRHLKSKDIEFKTSNPIKVVKDTVMQKPRSISQFREEISTFDISFSESETKDSLSMLVFEEKFSDLSRLSNEDMYEDLKYFKLAKPLVKIVINSQCFDQKSVNDFVDFLGKLVVDAKKEKNELSSGMDEKHKMFKEIRSQNSINGYLKSKVTINEKSIKRYKK